MYDTSKYDPRPADIWSLAIIYACMSLRRFPWKAPRLTDNSYKLFVSTPATTPPADAASRRSLDGKPKSALEKPSAAEEARPGSGPSAGPVSEPNSEDESNKHNHHHHHHRPRQGDDADESHQTPKSENVSSSAAAGSRPDATSTKAEVLKGPWRLLRLLPRETRAIMGKMLEIQPSHRATLDDMMEDPWITNTPVCSQDESCTVHRAPGHEHTLVPSSAPTPAPSHK